MSRPPLAAQPPTTAGLAQQPIDTNDDRILDSVWENDRLWFSANTACIPPGDSLIRSCARVVELSTATGTVTTDTDLSQRGAHLFYPAIRPDASGDLVIVYGESGVSVKPEAVAVGRAPDGTLTSPVVIAQSASAYLGERYGDYFGAARDPASPGLVWVAGEAGTDVAGSRGWDTSVASVSITAPGAPLPRVIDVVPPPLRAVHASGRAGKAIRLVFRALGDAVGVRSVVTVQSKGRVVFRSTTAPPSVHTGSSTPCSGDPARSWTARFRTACTPSRRAARRRLRAARPSRFAEHRAQLRCVRRSGGRLVVAEVDVHRLLQRADLRRELRRPAARAGGGTETARDGRGR